jgi:hypothetical protein
MKLKYRKCVGQDVYKDTVVVCIHITEAGETYTDVQTFSTTTAELYKLKDWLDG